MPVASFTWGKVRLEGIQIKRELRSLGGDSGLEVNEIGSLAEEIYQSGRDSVRAGLSINNNAHVM